MTARLLIVLLLATIAFAPEAHAAPGWETPFVPTGFDASPVEARVFGDEVLLRGPFQRVGAESLEAFGVFDGSDFADVGSGLVEAITADGLEIQHADRIGFLDGQVYVAAYVRDTAHATHPVRIYTRPVVGTWSLLELPAPLAYADVKISSYAGRLLVIGEFQDAPDEIQFAYLDADGSWDRIAAPQLVLPSPAPAELGRDGVPGPSPLYTRSRITITDASDFPIQYTHHDGLFRLDGDTWTQLRVDVGSSHGPAPAGGYSTYYDVTLHRSGDLLVRVVDETGSKDLQTYDPVANDWIAPPRDSFEYGIEDVVPVDDGFLVTGEQQGAAWIRHFDGTNWTVLATGIEALPDVVFGLGDAVFAFGPFESIDGVAVRRAAVWSQGNWAALFPESDSPPAPAHAIESYLADTLVGIDGGPFPQSQTAIASWNDVVWAPFPGLALPYAQTRVIAVHDDAIWVGAVATFDEPEMPHVSEGVRATVWRDGVATEVGNLRGIDADWMYPYDESDYAPAVVRAYASFRGAFYAGGTFEKDSSTGVDGLRSVATLNATETGWDVVPTGFPSLRSYEPYAPFNYVDVNALAVHDGMLFIGGHFELSGNRAALAAFDGTTDVDVAAGLFLDDAASEGDLIRREVLALASTNGRLYVGGLLDADAPTAPHAHLVVRNEVTGAWEALGDGVNGPVHVITPYEHGILVGGRFSEAGGQPANSIAYWDGATWWPFDGGVTDAEGNPGTVYALHVNDLDLHVGGEFLRAGSTVSANYAIYRGFDAVSIEDPEEPGDALSFRNALRGAYPNPFNPSTKIAFELVSGRGASLRVYAASGRLVREFDLGAFGAGQHEVTWNGTDAAGRTVASGVYFAQLVADGRRVDATRLVLVK